MHKVLYGILRTVIHVIHTVNIGMGLALKVHKIEIFFGFDFEICIISLLVTSKY